MDERGYVTYCASVDGISVEHVVRRKEHNMKVRHFHDEYEIFYILDGQRQFFIHNRSFIAEKGDLILIDSDMIHMTRSPSKDNPGYDRIIFYISSKRMESMEERFPDIRLSRFLMEHSGIYRLNEKQQKMFMQMYETFKDEQKEKKLGYKTVIEAITVFSLLRIIRDLPQGESILPLHLNEQKYKRVYAIADYLSQNFEKPHSLDDLAAQFYISKFYMCRQFKEVVGYTVTEYLTILRMQRARQYLQQTNLSVSAIAEKTGYNSLTHFEREFKRYMTVSPIKYRNTLNTVTQFDISVDFPPEDY